MIERTEPASEIDLRAIGAALKRRRRSIWIPALVAFIGIALFVNIVTPRYTAESQVLLENQENFFTRPERPNVQPEQAGQLDELAVASQVQLVNSRDIARRAIKQLHLAGNSEFDVLANGLNPLTRVLILLGAVPDPTRESPETRLVNKFLERLSVYSPAKTRVISIQFTSKDAELAARAANLVAQLYLQEQAAAKRKTAQQAADSLGLQVASLRSKLAAADAERERYRLKSGLLAGTNNMTLSGQQLAELNTDLSKARSTQADAQAKAAMIRELIRDGKAADVTEVINNDIVRRISDQRVTAKALLARESRTLGPSHPRIKELQGQVAEFDAGLKAAAKQAAVTLENEAKIAGTRVTNLEAVLARQTQVAGVANGDEVHLRTLDRIAQTYKEQLESSSAKYEEALARENSTGTPSDARIISSASPPQEPSFPKKIPFIVFGTVSVLVFAVGFIVAGELLSDRAGRPVEARPNREVPAPAGAVAPPVTAGARRSRFFDEDETLPAPPSEAPRAPEPASDPVFAPVAPTAAPPRKERPSVEKLRSLANGDMLAATLGYLKTFGRSALASKAESRGVSGSGIGWDRADMVGDAEEPQAGLAAGIDVSPLVERIVAAHVPGRGLHVVGTRLGDEEGGDLLIELGRKLSIKGRTIIVDLNRTPFNLAPLAALNSDSTTQIAGMQGLAELLAGDATFAEVIHRDHGSRLHFIPAGLQEADFRDFDLILDALTETYDFVELLTPAFPHSEIAKVMAPYADFVVLSAKRQADPKMIEAIEAELIAAGAREVLAAGQDGANARMQVA